MGATSLDDAQEMGCFYGDVSDVRIGGGVGIQATFAFRLALPASARRQPVMLTSFSDKDLLGNTHLNYGKLRAVAPASPGK